MIGGGAVAEGRRRGGGDYATTQEDCSSASVAQISRRDSVREEAGRERDARARRKELLRQAAAESGSLPEHAGPAYYRPCAHQRQTTQHTPTDSAAARHRRRRLPRHGGGGIVIGCCRCGGDSAVLVLAVLVLAAPAGCTCCSPAALLCLCLWLRLRATAAAAPLQVEDREGRISELTCEQGLSPPGAPTQDEL